ncbi:hypothetical protein JX266_008051 [Neoarthrinium moseri]|nr:hypothetical protein JX266_008051 [Neoarthrinium moseri]
MSQQSTGTGDRQQRGLATAKAKPKNPTKTRSRNGCPQCKAKRLKCDETKPECLMCVRNGRTCPGYTQSFKWSTKHEKSLVGKAKGPSNLRDLVTATSKAIPRDNSQGQKKPPGSIGDTPIDSDSTLNNPSALGGNSHPDVLVGITDESSPPTLDNLMLPEYDYGIEDLLQDIWQEDPQSHEIVPAGASKNDIQFSDQSFSLFNTPGDQSPFSFRTAGPAASPKYQPIFSQIPRTINDSASILVEEWFRRVCSMWSGFDSDVNLNRRLAHESWTKSEAVRSCLQSMSAVCLSSQMPQMRQVAVSHLRSAIKAIQKDLQVAQKQPVGTFPTELLLALCCVGTAACWIDTKEIGGSFLREAKHILRRINLDSNNLSIQDRQMMSFFNNSVIYWNMLVAVVSDEKDDLGIPKLKEPSNKELTRPIIPHPWTGISANAQSLFTQAVRLCRRFRRHHKPGAVSTKKSLETLLKDIKEAQDIEEQLLSIEQYDPHDISDTGDRMSPKSHFIDVAEGYRLASLLQLYQTFPDLVARRLPQDATELAGFVPWDNWIVPLSLRLVKTLQGIPINSGTRCIQPLLYLSASTGLRFDTETLMQQRLAERAMSDLSSMHSGASSSPDPTIPSSLDNGNSEEPQITITRLSIEVTYARRFVMERLSALEHTLPPAPVRVAKSLVQAIWTSYDSEKPGANYTHWIEVMEESNLRTIFG